MDFIVHLTPPSKQPKKLGAGSCLETSIYEAQLIFTVEFAAKSDENIVIMTYFEAAYVTVGLGFPDDSTTLVYLVVAGVGKGEILSHFFKCLGIASCSYSNIAVSVL